MGMGQSLKFNKVQQIFNGERKRMNDLQEMWRKVKGRETEMGSCWALLQHQVLISADKSK